MKAVITQAAYADLECIGDYIGRGNPERAWTFIEELTNRCLKLAEMPQACPVTPRYEEFGIRRCVHRNYLIFYRIRNRRIEVLRILQGARDYESLLFPLVQEP